MGTPSKIRSPTALTPRQHEHHAVRVELLDGNRLAIQQPETALRRVDLLVEKDLKAENDVIGIEGLAIRKSQSAPELDFISEPVGGHFPRFGELRAPFSG